MALPNIQATHQIINLFETSKMQVDDDIDSLPGIYAVIDLDGKIYKGNKILGDLLKTDYEYLLGRFLTDLFSSYDWMNLRDEMHAAIQKKNSAGNIQADLTINGVRSNYVWNFYPLKNSRRNDLPPLMTVIGRDITEQISATQRNARMAHELEMASLIQRALFPPSRAQFGESSIAGFYISATECAGDWWFYKTVDDKLFVFIGDVEGHGVPSAMITSAVRAAVSLVDLSKSTPSQILSTLSRVVLSVATDQKVMTFSVYQIDLSTGEVIYSNAAHEPGLLIPNLENYKIQDVIGLASDAAVPLGTETEFVYNEVRVKLNRGDRLVFFSDGILDVMNNADQKWTRVSLRRALVPLLGKPKGASDLAKNVQTSINNFRGGTQLLDDVTFVVFQF